jgi:hypothetical protein
LKKEADDKGMTVDELLNSRKTAKKSGLAKLRRGLLNRGKTVKKPESEIKTVTSESINAPSNGLSSFTPTS